ncbi:hypothetical protein QJS10_CPA05g00553 [Acorus calamus]|uniref:Uncharacterized protein n=1 Tax=Acorus calamus TaxID=4465 RepID=A0AAV9ET72_ACOCL|nr:hypothetical protein QJS10_CPA05g00553 [Acorus calamus]
MESSMDPLSPTLQHLKAAFLSMEPTDCIISLARDTGGGHITEEIQCFILEHCIKYVDNKGSVQNNIYITSLLKKIIVELESSCDDVLEGLYELYACCMTSLKGVGSRRTFRSISYFFPDGSKNLVVPLQCSLNMLEGDTGCFIWPSSLFMSEFILSYPELFLNKFCFEVGSGVGLVGIALAFSKCYRVVLSDGGLSSLANMKSNLELNQLCTEDEALGGTLQHANKVECRYLPWESTSETELQGYQPDIVTGLFLFDDLQVMQNNYFLGADVIYDPLCVPHLVRVLANLLKREGTNPNMGEEKKSLEASSHFHDNDEYEATDDNGNSKECLHGSSNRISHDGGSRYSNPSKSERCESVRHEARKAPVAYIAQVIRKEETFNYFLKTAEEARLVIADVTGKWKPMNLLPYMRSYDRSSISLYQVSYAQNGCN